ncbi:MAG: hypothetical protein IJN04_00920 [Clostridia bacterium]|nr:hypothetical protein [Clostridia bacterium]
MKRFLAILMAVVLLCGTCLLTACNGGNGKDNGKKDEPVDLYTVVKEATEKTLAATAYEAKSVFVMDTEMFGTKMNTTSDFVFTCNGKEVGVDGKSVVEMMGSKAETPIKFYYDGEYLYMTMLGEGYKMAATEEEFAEEVGHSDAYIKVLPKELFEGVTGTADRIELTVDDATLKSLYSEAIGEVIGEEMDDLSNITIKDGKITLSVKDGYLAAFNVAYTCEIAMGEEDTVTYVCSQTTEFVRYGDVTVTPMEGYKDFEEMDGDSLFGDDDLAWDDDDLFGDDDSLFEDDDFFFEDDELLFEDEL